MMTVEYFKMAFGSVKNAKFRSSLTMFGVIVGISSVVTIVSLGEGVKQQISKQIDKIGSDIILVQPGKKTAQRFEISLLPQSNPVTGTLTEQDLQAVRATKEVKMASPLAYVGGQPVYDKTSISTANIYASDEKLVNILKQPVAYGGFFEEEELDENLAVIGRGIADELFKDKVPLGKTLSIQGVNFLVTGIFEQADYNGLSYSIDFNNSVVIPYQAAKKLNNVQLFEILAQINDGTAPDASVKAVTASISKSRQGDEEFKVLKQDETVAATDSIFYQVTLFVGGVALISLVVGGIGIMNIMFATVSERTREIGIRKAVGATNQQIMGQFVTEAIVLSFVGCMIGVIFSLLINAFLRVTTNLEPVITLPVVAIAVGVAAATGIISGILPAVKAAKKDPIEALRYDR